MRIIDIERTLHVFIEPSIQAWALNKHWLIDVADWVYLNGHYFVTFAVLRSSTCAATTRSTSCATCS